MLRSRLTSARGAGDAKLGDARRLRRDGGWFVAAGAAAAISSSTLMSSRTANTTQSVWCSCCSGPEILR